MVRPVLPSGAQVRINHEGQQAIVTEVGATLREYSVDGIPIVDGFDAGEMAASGRGQVLAPWPNRLAGGAYTFDGREHRLPLTEPEKGNAIHGLVRYAAWVVAGAARSRVVMTHRLHPQPGYPFVVDLTVSYTLDDGGLTVELGAVNRGADRCPFGAGAHPYLSVDDRGVAPVVLESPAAACYHADERGIPTARQAVDGTPYDFRQGRTIGDTVLDTAFTDLAREPDGRAVVRLSGASRTVELWVDERYTHLMIYTGDTISDPARRRRSVAVEPMTCAPDAFRSGDGLAVLEPGASFTARWGITTRPGAAP